MIESILKFVLGNYLNWVNRFWPKWGGKKAFMLFCYPFPIKLRPHQKAFFDTAEKSFYEYRAKRIALYKWGSGEESVFCIHGWQSQSYRWKKYIESLVERGYTVYAIDAPGHGNSEGTLLNVPVYAHLILDVIKKYKPMGVIAHSFGAHSLLYVLHHETDLSVKKIVTMGCPNKASYFIQVFKEQLKLRDKTIENMVTYFRSYAGKDPSYYEAEEYVKTMVIPGFIVHDEDDKDVMVADAHVMHKFWPNSKLKITKGLGHKLKSLELRDEIVDYITSD